MAFDLSDLQNQVQLLSAHDGLDSKVTTWANRTICQIATHAYWVKQLGKCFVSHSNAANATHPTVVADHWITIDTIDAEHDEFVAPYSVEHVVMTAGTNTSAISTYKAALVHRDLHDIYAQMSGASIQGLTNTIGQQYAMAPALNTALLTQTTNYQKMMVYPANPNTTTTIDNGGMYAITYLGTPVKLSDGADYNWIVSGYFKLVLAGVMRYVRLYLGDPQGYLLEKAEFENGLRDMLMHEEVITASAPYRQGITPDMLVRQQ